MQLWQTMIMAKSTAADEDLSMKPRTGFMLGVSRPRTILDLRFLRGTTLRVVK